MMIQEVPLLFTNLKAVINPLKVFNFDNNRKTWPVLTVQPKKILLKLTSGWPQPNHSCDCCM